MEKRSLPFYSAPLILDIIAALGDPAPRAPAAARADRLLRWALENEPADVALKLGPALGIIDALITECARRLGIDRAELVFDLRQLIDV
ncbi:hypothetical protein [Microbacterium sp. F2]|uniref:hypothetical protein n=1 Tax=Microbacterium sp. F2 TaxID=3422228 RepID=UPI003FD37270